MEKLFRDFSWGDGDYNPGSHLVNWKDASLPLLQGGLGIGSNKEILPFLLSGAGDLLGRKMVFADRWLPMCMVKSHLLGKLYSRRVSYNCPWFDIAKMAPVFEKFNNIKNATVAECWDNDQGTWNLAFLLYAALVMTAVFILIFHFIPQYGQTHIMVYIGVCSLVGSLSVMSVKAIGIALKLTLSGMNQLIYPQTWIFTLVVITCVLTQMNYLNKALDTFNTAVVSPIYYVMFTSFTILASVIMFKDWDRQSPTQVVTEMCGFVTILSGTFLLHKTKDMVDGPATSLSIRLSKHAEEDGFSGGEGIPLRRQESSRMP
ncbi:probable magnesium transporter NIPA4 isoform X2 [Benincasa hispida]|uniref:probable magnesium transporter NIPA4 isoform X2 n=1 Tax=Benincasa hispida TaxID=102211 RepID=UPI0019004E36|nr:probable magnesium transporter NIPA4 isoform X2 [Benincasa hispida]